MFRIDDPSAVGSLPTPAAAGTEGFFTEGNPGTGVPATRVTGDFLNMVMEELRGVVVAGGLTPSKTDRTQLLAAIKAVAKAQFTQNIALPGWVKFPNGLIFQWGTITGASPVAITFPIAFPGSPLLVMATANTSNNSQVNINVGSPTLTGVTVYPSAGGAGSTFNFNWIAIGA